MVMQYLILNDKQPIHKFKNGIGGKTWDEVKDSPNVGVVVPKPFIVLDFDDMDDAKAMWNMIVKLDLKCRVMRTNRGIHVWFKSEKTWRNFVHERLVNGLHADCRSHSRNAYVKIKSDGVMRKWLKFVEEDEIQEVPNWLLSKDKTPIPLNVSDSKFEFFQARAGSGRNNMLFQYIVPLQKAGFNREQIMEIVDNINNYVFDNPLGEKELSSVLREDAFKSDEEIATASFFEYDDDGKPKKFKHNVFGDALISMYNILTLNNTLYIYDDGFYTKDERVIERKMIQMLPTIKTSNRTEVLNYIKIMTHKSASNIVTNPYVVNLKNTRLDLRTGEMLDFTPEAVEFDRVPVDYDPDATCQVLDDVLNRVFKNNQDVIDLFYEMVGYCLIKTARYAKGFMFYGSGSNGKSTILDLLTRFIGLDNISTLALNQVTERFKAVELENKLANIGDDIDNVPVKDSGELKKMFAGNPMTVERKGEQPYTIKPYATHIYSANEIPRSPDKTYGFYRRWIFIPFTAKFTSDDPDFDPMIDEKLSTDECMSYLLNRAIEGVQRLLKRGKFTQPECVSKLLKTYQSDNSATLSWVDENRYDKWYLLSYPSESLYQEFVSWCGQAGIQKRNIVGRRNFYKEITAYFDFDPERKQKKDGQRYFVEQTD